MTFALAVLLGLVACSKAPDECSRVIDKSWRVLDEIAQLRGKALAGRDRDKLVEQCRKAVASGKRDPSVACVLAAKDDVGVRDCYMKGFEASYLERSKATEAKLQLDRLGKHAKEAFIVANVYPVGSAGPTPATACCSQPTKTCAPNAADWAQPLWQALDFEITESFRFQYRYESDGKTFTATAVGDLACDGKTTTLTAIGSVTADGRPQVSIAN